MEFLEFVKSKNLDIDNICTNKLWQSIGLSKKWIYIDDSALEWIGYKKEDRFNRKDYINVLSNHFTENYDFIDETKSSFYSKKNSYNILFEFVAKESNRAKYLTVSPDCFKESLMLLNNEKAKQIRMYYILLEKLFIEYCEINNTTIRNQLTRLKEEVDILKKNQSNIKVHYLNEYKPLESNTFIYVMATRSYMSQNLFKIGHTADLIKRVKQHKTGRASGDEMYLLFYMKVFNSEIIEKFIFTKLEQFRHNKYELFHINYYMLMDIMKKIEKMEIDSNNDFNSIFSKYKPEDIEKVDLSKDIEIISKEVESVLDKKYEPPVERIRKINEAKHVDTESINEKFKEVNMCLLEEYTGNCEEQQSWGCLNVLRHSFKASYSHAKWKYLDGNNKKGLVGKKGCPYCSKQQILDKIKWYSYRDKTYEFLDEFESFEDLKDKEMDVLDTEDKIKILKNIVREQRWLTPVDEKVYSILSPDENKLNLNKVLTEYETYIIEIMEINYNMMKQRIFKSKFNLIISIDEQGKKAYVSDSMTQLSLKLAYVGTADKKLNRKTIAKYVDSEKNYAGYIFRSCDNSLIEKYKEKYEVAVI